MPIATPEQLARYEAAPSQVIATLAGLNAAQLHHRPAEGEWSIHEIVIHLADSEVMGYERLRKTLAEEDATLTVYDEAQWAQKLSYQTQDRELAISLFRTLRASTSALFRFLPTTAWELTSNHPERGKISVYDLFNIYLDHGEIHLQQIAHIKQAFSTLA